MEDIDRSEELCSGVNARKKQDANVKVSLRDENYLLDNDPD
jgi:hypothetical protein